jgi:hypothetical protein
LFRLDARSRQLKTLERHGRYMLRERPRGSRRAVLRRRFDPFGERWDREMLVAVPVTTFRRRPSAA